MRRFPGFSGRIMIPSMSSRPISIRDIHLPALMRLFHAHIEPPDAVAEVER